MRERLRQYSDYIGYAGLIFVLVPLLVSLVRGPMTIYGQIILALGIALLLVYLFLEYQRILRFFMGRQARYGSNVLIMTISVLGIVAFIAFLSERYSHRIDLTKEHIYSISQQTSKILDNLDKPITIIGFYQAGDFRKDRVETLLKDYARRSRLISYEFIDPDAKPALFRQYGMTDQDYNTMLVESDGRRQKVTGTDEADITAAIIKVTRGEGKAVYFLTGHGERDITDYTQQGLSFLKEALERDNYVVKTLNLAATATYTGTITGTLEITATAPITGPTQPGQGVLPIPADAAVIVIPGPQTTLPEAEWKTISDWLQKGGRLLVMQDPLAPPTGLEDALLVNWGLRIDNDIIVDLGSAYLGDPLTPVVLRFRYAPITKDMRAQVVLPGARSIRQESSVPQGALITPLIESSDQSWGETNLQSRSLRYDEGADIRGPLAMAVSAEKDAPEGKKARLVIMGSATMATDRVIKTGGNLDFIVNSINWLAEEEGLISIRPRTPEQRYLFVPPTEASLMALLVVVGMPGLVLLAGVLVWMRRR
jgi:ABC-type uncharacterized transport system involved in gliding motility auxiliary subunit